MLHLIQEEMERHLGQTQGAVMNQLFLHRIKWAAYYLITIVASCMAFGLLLFLVFWAIPEGSWIVGSLLAILALLVLILGEYLRTSASIQDKTAYRMLQVVIWRTRIGRGDFLATRYWLSLLFVVLPFVVFLAFFLLGLKNMVLPDTAPFASMLNKLQVTTTFAGWLLAGQIALFNFLFSYSLGKYSTKLATIIVKHRAVAALQYTAVLLVAILLTIQQWGCPRLCLTSLWLLHVSLVASLILTISVSRKGVDTDGLLVYAGHLFSRKLRKAIVRPITAGADSAKLWWRLLQILGLDFRRMERFKVFSEPIAGASLCKQQLTLLFSAANKTIMDGQHESLRAALYSIYLVMDTYSLKRADHLSSEDSAYSYCNDQFSALMRAAARAPNEHLAEEIVCTIGRVGQTVLRIKYLPDPPGGTEENRRTRREHTLAMYWIGLLEESFDQLHSLQRSAAPKDVLEQLRCFAIHADSKGDPSVVVNSYFPTIERLIMVCVLHRDAYHQILMVQCVCDVLTVWNTNLRSHHDYLGDYGSIHKRAIKTIQSAAQHGGVGSARDMFLPAQNLAQRLTGCALDGRLALQDIFMSIVQRQIADIYEQNDATNGLIEVINLISELAVHAAREGSSDAKTISAALYEVSFFVFQKLPQTFEVIHDPFYDACPVILRRRRTSEDEPRNRLEAALFIAWNKVMPALYITKGFVFDWEQEYFGFVGLAICAYEKRNEERLKEGVRRCVENYLTLIKNELCEEDKGAARLAHGNGAYLQLCGAWISKVIELPELAERVTDFVSLLNIRNPPSGMSLGYPDGESIGGKFCLPPLSNIRKYISQEDWDIHKSYESRLTADEVLFSYYKKVQDNEEAVRKGEKTVLMDG
ncbi:MAG: hypothetical protein HOO88_01110 [Kiritimatiellaceae bacterium]|nr:hypothetical protein [Kiritimatiellaceae bacterium]